jgi:hypothetical protein
MSAHLGWVARGLGAFDQGPSGMGVAGCGDRPLPASLPTGICCGEQAQRLHHVSGILDAREVATCGHHGHRDAELHPTQTLQGLDHRLKSPGVDLLLQCLIPSLVAYGVRSDRAAVCLEDNRWSGGGTDDVGEPPQMSRAPRGVACIAAIVSEQQGVETARGGLEIADGIFTSPAEVADGFIFHRGDIDGGEITRAHQAGQLDGVTTVSLDAVAGLCGNQGRGNDPADVASFDKITIEPVVTRPRFIDKDQVLGLGWHLAHALLNSGLPGADGAEVDHLRIVICGDIGHGDGVFVDIQSAVKRARVVHG